ncbi:hypothetical protein MKEN_01169100 [Mycena kentingensis (nom. inval.)]|nr:hypothetical protein MKEN_01169100 [Mycena kentingensis (nom. inval.)]
MSLPLSSSPGALIDDDDYANDAEQSSPVRPTRSSSSNSGGTGGVVLAGTRRSRDEYENDNPFDFSSCDPNDLEVVMRYATRARLSKDDQDDVRAYMNYPPSVQRGIDHVDRIVLKRELKEVKDGLPATKFEVPEEIKTNASARGYAQLCAPTTAVYKGKAITDLITNYLVEKGDDLPPNIKQNAAAVAKIKKAVGNALSDNRAFLKKDIIFGFRLKEGEQLQLAGSPTHLDLLDLTKHVMRHVPNLQVTYEHCARVALMRKVYLLIHSPTSAYHGKNFWASLEAEIKKITKAGREAAEKHAAGKPSASEVAKRISNIYRGIVEKDRSRHGAAEAASDGIDELASGRTTAAGAAPGFVASATAEEDEDERDEDQ